MLISLHWLCLISVSVLTNSCLRCMQRVQCSRDNNCDAALYKCMIDIDTDTAIHLPVPYLTFYASLPTDGNAVSADLHILYPCICSCSALNRRPCCAVVKMSFIDKRGHLGLTITFRYSITSVLLSLHSLYHDCCSLKVSRTDFVL